jgi:hypothetical protein
MEKLEIINKILNGSATKLRESYFINKHNDIYDEIIQYCININDLPFKQKLWHWVNDNPNYFTCKCGKYTTFNKNWLNGYRKFCTPKCAQTETSTKEKRKKTTLEKYGVENIAMSETSKKKQEETNLLKYGSKSSFQNKEVKEKWKKTINDKYGVNHYFQTDEFKIKSIETNNIKYGADYYVQTDDYINKTINTNIEKYGKNWYTQTFEYKEKAKKTNIEKYGVDSFLKTYELRNILRNNKTEISEKIKKKSLEKWGVDCYSKTDEFKKIIKNKWDSGIYSNIKSKSIETNNILYGVDWYTQKDDFRKYLKSDEFKNKIRYSLMDKSISYYKNIGYDLIDIENGFVKLKGECNHIFDIEIYNVSRRNINGVIVCTKCNPINSGQSGQELNLISWLLSLDLEIHCKRRDIISPLELDVYIPSKKVAIEFNGLYWHSEKYKDKKYHLDKSLKCSEQGIDLIHVWEDDWMNRRNIIKSIILSRLGLIENKIYGRKCQIKIVDNRELVNNFFNDNHIQGKTKYKTAIGLYYNNEMVSCMLFNKPKKSLELVRFANKKDYSVIGAASKLFKYYVNNNDFEEIVSFADRSIFNGNLYKTLGFEFVWKTDVNYWWVVNYVRRHRFNYSKSKLIKNGGDPNKTEVQIMLELGHFRVWGCGLDKWVWKKNGFEI